MSAMKELATQRDMLLEMDSATAQDVHSITGFDPDIVAVLLGVETDTALDGDAIEKLFNMVTHPAGRWLLGHKRKEWNEFG